jgi:hypothetical protein
MSYFPGIRLVCVCFLSLLFLSSCGSDDLCLRATERVQECVLDGPAYDFCEMVSDCPECGGVVLDYAECVVEAEDCVEVANGCMTEASEWISCISVSECE